MTGEEWAAYLERLAVLCDQAMNGGPDPAAARSALIAALADPACPLNLAATNGYAEALRLEVGLRSEMIRRLDPALFAHRAALNGLKQYFIWAQANVPAPAPAVRSPSAP